jgi:hypothetical protein
MKGTLQKRLATVEQRHAEQHAAWERRQQTPLLKRHEAIMTRLTLLPEAREMFETLSGFGSWRGQKLVIAGEREIEAAIVKYVDLYEATARAAGYAREEVECLRTTPGRCPLLGPCDGSTFSRALHRFGSQSNANLVVALRYQNAVSRWGWADESGLQAAEWESAKAAFEARFEAFRAQDERATLRRERVAGRGVRGCGGGRPLEPWREA